MEGIILEKDRGKEKKRKVNFKINKHFLFFVAIQRTKRTGQNRHKRRTIGRLKKYWRRT